MEKSSEYSPGLKYCSKTFVVIPLGSLTYSELGTMIPKSGGEYAYFTEALIPIIAYMFVWTRTIVIQPSAVAIICMVFASYFMSFFEHCGQWGPIEKIVAIVTICECHPFFLSYFLFSFFPFLLVSFFVGSFHVFFLPNKMHSNHIEYARYTREIQL